MWRSPTEVRTEPVPRIGRSGDSPVSEGACSGLAVKSERTWSGWLVTTGPPGIAVRMRKISPMRRWAPKTYSIWRMLKRSIWDDARQRARPAACRARRARPARSGRREKEGRVADEVREGRILGAGGTLGDGAHASIVTEIDVKVAISPGAMHHSLQSYGCSTEGGQRSSPPWAPQAGSPTTLARLIEAGADVFRLNFSHADRDRHARTVEAIRAAAERVGDEVAVLGDLPGPKLRIGELRDDVAELETGTHVKLTPQAVEGDKETIPVSWPGVTSLHEDEPVYLADGSIRLRVRGPEDGGLDCEVEVGGTLSSHKGMNVPGISTPAATDGDLDWVEFAVQQGIDLLAVSFVSTAADLEPVAERLDATRLRYPPDRQDREAAGCRERRGDRRRGDRGI